MTDPKKAPKVLIAAGDGHITEVEMIKGLHETGVDIHAVLQSTSPHLKDLHDAGVPTRSLDLKNNADLSGALKIRRWIKEEGFDIVHGLANRQVANFIWASYGLPNKVIAYRGAVGHVSRWDPTCYIKWLNPRIDKIICVSKAVERDLAANGVDSGKLITIYKGHDLSWYAHLDRKSARAELEKQFSIPTDAILVGMAANMRHVKGADLLLKALMQLPENVHGLFIGEIRDPLISKLAHYPCIASRVHFTGFTPNAPKLIGALDFNIAPSRGREGLTKTVIEGMAQGVPAIVSDAGGLPELVENEVNGYIFKAGKIEDLIEKMSLLIKDKSKIENFGNASVDFVKKKFSIEKTKEETLALYRRLT